MHEAPPFLLLGGGGHDTFKQGRELPWAYCGEDNASASVPAAIYWPAQVGAGRPRAQTGPHFSETGLETGLGTAAQGEASTPEPSVLPDRSGPREWKQSRSRASARYPRHGCRSHVGSFPLQSRVVGARHGVPGIHVAVHTHGDAFLLRVVQGAPGLPDALPETFVRHPLQQLLRVGHGDLHLHLLHDDPRVQLPAARAAEVRA